MLELRQGFSKVSLKGKLVENTLEEKISPNTGQSYIAGDLVIQTDKDNLVKVNMYAGKFKKAGGESKLFKSFKSVMNSYKSVADVGEEAGNDVEFNSAKLQASPFMSNDGDIIENYKVKGAFPNRISGDYEPKAQFEVEVVVDSIFDEIDSDTEMETGSKIIKAYYVGYGNRVVELEFVVESPKGISYVESQYKKGDTVKLVGNLINEEVTVKSTEEMGFGEDVVRENTRTKRKLLVTRGSTPYANGKEYAIEEIMEAIKIRNINLKSKTTKKKAKPAPKAKAAVSDGFNPSNC
jgi:hypothetical protein